MKRWWQAASSDGLMLSASFTVGLTFTTALSLMLTGGVWIGAQALVVISLALTLHQWHLLSAEAKVPADPPTQERIP